MCRVGYIRVSSKEQNWDRQIENLSGVSKVFSDKLSGGDGDRPGLSALLSFIREGDIVVVSQSKGATIEILSLPSLSGIRDENLRQLLNNLIIEIYKYQAEEERKRILERQRQGIEIAKRKGKYKGRKPMFKRNDIKLQHAFDLFLAGHSDREVEELVGINARTFRRYREKYNVSRKKTPR